jgi:hypothetical protein
MNIVLIAYAFKEPVALRESESLVFDTIDSDSDDLIFGDTVVFHAFKKDGLLVNGVLADLSGLILGVNLIGSAEL